MFIGINQIHHVNPCLFIIVFFPLLVAPLIPCPQKSLKITMFACWSTISGGTRIFPPVKPAAAWNGSEPGDTMMKSGWDGFCYSYDHMKFGYIMLYHDISHRRVYIYIELISHTQVYMSIYLPWSTYLSISLSIYIDIDLDEWWPDLMSWRHRIIFKWLWFFSGFQCSEF